SRSSYSNPAAESASPSAFPARESDGKVVEVPEPNTFSLGGAKVTIEQLQALPTEPAALKARIAELVRNSDIRTSAGKAHRRRAGAGRVRGAGIAGLPPAGAAEGPRGSAPGDRHLPERHQPRRGRRRPGPTHLLLPRPAAGPPGHRSDDRTAPPDQRPGPDVR